MDAVLTEMMRERTTVSTPHAFERFPIPLELGAPCGIAILAADSCA